MRRAPGALHRWVAQNGPARQVPSGGVDIDLPLAFRNFREEPRGRRGSTHGIPAERAIVEPWQI